MAEISGEFRELFPGPDLHATLAELLTHAQAQYDALAALLPDPAPTASRGALTDD